MYILNDIKEPLLCKECKTDKMFKNKKIHFHFCSKKCNNIFNNRRHIKNVKEYNERISKNKKKYTKQFISNRQKELSKIFLKEVEINLKC